MELEKWLDNTKMGTFERCPREFFLRHILMLTRESEGSVATEFGKAFHHTLELYFSGTDKDEAIQSGVLKLQESINRLIEAGDERVYEDARADIDTFVRAIQYFLTAGAGQELRSIVKNAKCELKLTYTEPESKWSLLGRIDLLAETHAGQHMLVDFKTTSWGLRGWGNKLLTDTQLQTYAFIATKTLVVKEVHAGAYAILHVQRRKLKSGQFSPNITLDSALLPLALTQDHLARAENRFLTVSKSIEHAYESRHFPCVWSQCNRLTGVCQFHPLCERFWRSSLENSEVEHIYEIAFSLGYIQHRWHPFEED